MTVTARAAGTATIVTIAAKNYLAQARVLAHSLRQHHPKAELTVILADEVGGCFDPESEPFRLVPAADLGIPDFPRLVFRYGCFGLCTALKPHALELGTRAGHPTLYIDADVMACGDPAGFGELLNQFSVVLTPHLLGPLEGPDRVERERTILLSGAFNAGIVGVAPTAAGRAFLSWWEDRVSLNCRGAVGEGMYYDQRWLDLAPGLFESVHVLRDPGYNVGHWNLPERVIERRADGYLVDGHPLRLFHFSGFDPEHPERVTRYFDRLHMDSLGDAAHLFSDFHRSLMLAGWNETRRWPYAFECFDNGVPIPEIARDLYREFGDEVGRFGDPFSTVGPDSYFGWLNERVDPAHSISRLWGGVHRRRADLRDAFPEPFGRDHDGFASWIQEHGAQEHDVSEALRPYR